jgi:hypothetical protein
MLAADLSDETTRLVLSDALTDLGREEEVALCRDLSRRIRAADLGAPGEDEPPLGWRVVDFDDTRVEWLPTDERYEWYEVRLVRGPWEESAPDPKGSRSQTQFMLWYRADEPRPGRSREGWETTVVYDRHPFVMTAAHESLFRDAVREHAVANMVSGTRTWAIQWADGIIEQEPQGLALVQR